MDTAEQQLLLIDNDEVERKSVAAYLKGAGFIVLEASNVSQGLDILADHQPEVVLCDLNATGTDSGPLQAIKSDFADTPVIVMATDGVMNDVTRGEDILREFGRGVRGSCVSRLHGALARGRAVVAQDAVPGAL